MIPQMGVVTDVPIVLNSVQKQDDYEGNWQSDTRTIIWTLNFTVKGFVYGGFNQSGLITHTITNIYKNIAPTDNITFTIANTGIGEYQAGEIVYQGYSFGTATATAQVIDLNSLNNQITLTNINGNFVSTMPIIGAKSGATYTYTTTNFADVEYAKIDIVPVPSSNVSNNWIANTTITEY
jgi:hypothetical protein